MPEKKVIERARRDAAEGKSPSVQAGEFVHEEMRHVREGEHGVRSPKQAIAIGLSKARRAGVKLPPPPAERASPEVRHKAELDLKRAGQPPKSKRRSRAVARALKRETRRSVSSGALSRHARAAAAKRPAAERRRAARKAVATKGPAVRRAAARKAAHTRQRKS